MNHLKWYTEIASLSVKENIHDTFGDAIISWEEKTSTVRYPYTYQVGTGSIAMAVLSHEVFKKVIDNIKKEEVNECSRYLRSLPYFKNLQTSLSRKLAKYSKEVYFNKSQIVFNQGEKSKHLHIVIEGQFEII